MVEPWPGFYFDKSLGPEMRTNHSLRETVREEKLKSPGGATAVSCCGANPGMVSSATNEGIVVGCGEGALSIQMLQLPGGKPVGAASFLNSNDLAGVRFG